MFTVSFSEETGMYSTLFIDLCTYSIPYRNRCCSMLCALIYALEKKKLFPCKLMVHAWLNAALMLQVDEVYSVPGVGTVVGGTLHRCVDSNVPIDLVI